MIISFTGHRPNKLGGYNTPNPTSVWIKQKIKEELLDLNPDTVITGMALGVDQWAAEVCLELDIPFIAAVPFKGQENVWPDKSKQYYYYLLSKAQMIEVVCEGIYDPQKLQIRNEWLVNNSDIIIAIWDKSKGGTGNCVNYAMLRAKPIIFINPKDMEKNDSI
jgi:uncharacterized phage-like protein YoqJ